MWPDCVHYMQLESCPASSECLIFYPLSEDWAIIGEIDDGSEIPYMQLCGLNVNESLFDDKSMEASMLLI